MSSVLQSSSEHSPLLINITKPQPPEQGRSEVSTVSVRAQGYFMVFASATMNACRATTVHAALTLNKTESSRLTLTPSIALFITAVIWLLICIPVLPVIGFRDRMRNLNQNQRVQLIFHGILGGVMIFTNNIALTYIPVGTAQTLFAVAPAIASVLSTIFLQDSMGFVDVLVLLINLIGVVLVARPWSSTSSVHGITAGISSAILLGVNTTTVHAMGTKVHFVLMLFAMAVAALIVSIFSTPPLISLTIISANPGTSSLLAIGASMGFVAQLLLNAGIQRSLPGPCLLVRSANVPISFLFGLIFFHESLPLSASLGVVLVLGTVMYIGLSQVLKKQRLARGMPRSNQRRRES